MADTDFGVVSIAPNVTAATLENETDFLWSDETTEYANVSFILAWLILTFSLISFLTNLLSATVYSRRCMRSPINVLLTGLSLVDSILSLLWIPTFVVPCLFVYYRSPILKSIQSLSHVIIYPFTMMSHCSSVYIFVVISLERMIAVLRPFRARWHSNRRSVCALVLVVALSAMYNCVRFFEFRIAHDEDDPDAPIDSVPALRDSEQHPVYMAVYYNGMFFIVHFLVPFTVLTVVNTLMIISIYRANAERRLLTSQQKREHRTAIMMAMTVLSFLMCNTLQLILNAIELVNPEFFVDQATLVLAFTLNDVCNLLIVVNTSCTAFIYYFFCQKYRRVASALCTRVLKCVACRSTPDLYTCPAFVEDTRKGPRRSKPRVSQESIVKAYEPKVLHSSSAFRLSNGYQSIGTSNFDLSKSGPATDGTNGQRCLLDVPQIQLDEPSRLSWSPCDRRNSYGRYIEPDVASAPPVLV